jgi:spore coat protein E
MNAVNLREVITKAVCGRGEQGYRRTIEIPVPGKRTPIQVLGNYITNSRLEGSSVIEGYGGAKLVQVKGAYDIHVWYACEHETYCEKTTVNYVELIPIKTYGGESIINPRSYAEIVRRPVCRKVYAQESGGITYIKIEVEQEFLAEIIGETKLKIASVPGEKANIQTVRGIELVPPDCDGRCANHYDDYYPDLKCEEDLPEEEEEEEEEDKTC